MAVSLPACNLNHLVAFSVVLCCGALWCKQCASLKYLYFQFSSKRSNKLVMKLLRYYIKQQPLPDELRSGGGKGLIGKDH